MTNTLAIADQVNVPSKKQYHVPSFPLPAVMHRTNVRCCVT